MNISRVLSKQHHQLRRIKLWTYLFSTSAEEKIELPRRIPRGPTDILRALESTIQRDPTAAHYKYHDDPFLIPKSNATKRTYAMAREAGKKAAHWVRSENPELFNHKECDPPIEAFFPKVVFDENSEVTEDDLKRVIEKNQVSDAILINKLLAKQGAEISADTKQGLLELLCYNNGDDTLNEEFIEERWFRQSSRIRERQRKIWKDGHVAEEIFISIDNPTAEAYSAIIQGMAKYFQVDRANHLFEEAQQKGLVLNIDTYNSLIRVANFLKEGYELRWTYVINILQAINSAGIKPNLGTLNAVLHTLSTMGTSQNVKDLTLKTLRQFKDLGIEPCLGSWYYVLITYCKERGPKSNILSYILDEIEGKTFEIRDLTDTSFFVTAMDVSRNHLNDLNLGKRVHSLLLKGNNYNLIGDSFKESVYYRHYFALLLKNIPLEEFMQEVYYKLVPNIYVPEPSIMEEVLNQVEINGAVEYIPKLWSDMIIFEHSNRENLVNRVLNLMVNAHTADETDLAEKFGTIAWDIYTSINDNEERKYNQLSFTGDMLGNIMTLALQNNDFEKASTVMEKLDKGHTTIVGVPKFEALSLFVDHCIKNKAPSKAIRCIQYASDSGFPDAVVLGAKLNEQLTLDKNHLESLSKIVDLRVL
ncbi:protein PTCD3 homolog, mitochondrial [Sitophilus oryzae]|uniref:Small ribosomal subunit protein mS39 n=1 Tax=Sitophilus oryzae TaxID=7048 RepID=A0A6J2XK73_SITOR|nr:protein PTCD3 homolog, mitochondrial [Sitophilus oryzae]